MPRYDRTPVEHIDSGLTLHEALIDSLELYRDRPAIIASDSTISYRELAAIAHSVYVFLQTSATPSRAIIAVEAPAHALSIGAVVGILLSGRSYLPLDLQAPAAVRRCVIDQSGAIIVLNGTAVAALPSGTAPPTALFSMTARWLRFYTHQLQPESQKALPSHGAACFFTRSPICAACV